MNFQSHTNTLLLGTSKTENKRPAIIELYNYIKGGTDIEDQCMGNYSTKMKSNKWTMNTFCYLLDTARVNSQSIYYKVKNESVRNSNSYKYAMDLAKALITPHIERREKDLTGIQSTILHKMALVLGRDLKLTKKREAPIQVDRFESFVDKEHAKRCYMCLNALPSTGYSKLQRNMTRVQTQCGTCGKAVCKKHMINCCQPCARSFAVENQEEAQANRQAEVFFDD
jgi:hypothetical protein